MRALGCSVGGAVNRLGVILGPILVGVVYSAGNNVAAVFVMLGAVALAGAVVAGVLAEETANRPLEEISPDRPAHRARDVVGGPPGAVRCDQCPGAVPARGVSPQTGVRAGGHRPAAEISSARR